MAYTPTHSDDVRYADELAAREVAFRQEAQIWQMVRTRIKRPAPNKASEIREQHNHVASFARSGASDGVSARHQAITALKIAVQHITDVALNTWFLSIRP